MPTTTETPRPTADNLSDARRRARLDQAGAAAACGISLRAYQRQEAGKSLVHGAVYRMLLVLGGRLPDPAWHGWQLRDGRLWSPDGDSVTPGEVRAIALRYQQIAALEAHCAALERAARRVRVRVSPWTRARSALAAALAAWRAAGAGGA